MVVLRKSHLPCIDLDVTLFGSELIILTLGIGLWSLAAGSLKQVIIFTLITGKFWAIAKNDPNAWIEVISSGSLKMLSLKALEINFSIV